MRPHARARATASGAVARRDRLNLHDMARREEAPAVTIDAGAAPVAGRAGRLTPDDR